MTDLLGERTIIIALYFLVGTENSLCSFAACGRMNWYHQGKVQHHCDSVYAYVGEYAFLLLLNTFLHGNT
jgi:hypothetical protein